LTVERNEQTTAQMTSSLLGTDFFWFIKATFCQKLFMKPLVIYLRENSRIKTMACGSKADILS